MKLLLDTADIKALAEYTASQKPIEYVIEYYYQKPLKECTLIELLDGFVVNARASNWFEAVNYTDDGDCYTLRMSHNLGVNGSDSCRLLGESFFRSAGYRYDIQASGRTLFIKVYKAR